MPTHRYTHIAMSPFNGVCVYLVHRTDLVGLDNIRKRVPGKLEFSLPQYLLSVALHLGVGPMLFPPSITEVSTNFDIIQVWITNPTVAIS